MKKRKKSGRRLLSFLLTLAMVVGLIPGMSLTAYADGNVASVKVGETTTQYSTFAEAVAAWNNAANGATLTLLADVTTTSTISVSGTKTLDLNGYGIKMTANYRVFLISAGADMTMIDSNATRTGTGDNRPSNIVGGYVTGGRVLDASGGAILVNSNGKCTMTGGTICGNEAARKNAGYNYGGGVCVDGGYFEMTGGAIINNKAQYGGAVQVQNCTADGNGFVFGGTALLSENSCTDDGGGINIGRNGVVSITGGTITGNTATGKGGGIAFRSGGSSLSISGSPVISGNINDNIYLYSNKKITVSGELSNTTLIGITMQSLGVFTNSSNTEYNDLTRFSADNSNQIIGKDANGQLLMGATSNTVIVTPSSNMTKTTDSGEASQTVVTNGVMTDVVYTADDGYYFPTDYSVDAVSGITVTRNSYTQITVSGTPTANAEITLTAPTAKTTPDAPTTAAATDCTTADNNDGKLTGVTAEMEYKKSDAESWTAGTGSDITGLVPGTYYVRVKATDTTNASANQELTVNAASAAAGVSINIKWGDLYADETRIVGSYNGEEATFFISGTVLTNNTGKKLWISKPTDDINSPTWQLANGESCTLDGNYYTVTADEGYGETSSIVFYNYVPVTGIEFTSSKPLSVAVGEEKFVLARTIPANATRNKVSYTSSNEEIAKITEKYYGSEYYVTGVSVGTATITATSVSDPTKTTTYTVTVTSASAPATVKTAPTAKALTYTGSAQELVTAGTATGGTMQYALGTKDAATEKYTTSIPTATEAGTYYVWYKAVGNENYSDSKADVVTVTIKSSVTITFDSNGGSEVDPQVIDKGGKAEEPEEPTNGKLAFIGWFIDPTIENLYDLDNDKINSFDFSSPVEKDTELTAVWTAFARVNTIGTGKVNYAYEGEEKDDEYDDSIILSAIQGMADTFILTAKADEGSRFVKWQKVIEEGETVEDSTFEDYSEDEEITIKITEPISLVAVFETIDEDDKVYSSYESDTEWTKGSSKPLKICVKGSKDDDETINHFMGLKCNGKVIAEKYYTAKKGSVKIEIDPEYLETLEVGKHVLTVMFDDADDVEITFTVLAAKEETSKDAKVDVDDKSKASNDASTDKATESKTDKVANTGDNAQPLLALFVMIDAALALNYVLLRKRRDKRN